MKAAIALASLLLLVAGAAAAADIDDLLSGVDYVPNKPDLDEALGDPPEDDLIAIAVDTEADPGLRIRSYRALGHYPTDSTRLVLISAIFLFLGLRTFDKRAVS